MLCDCNWHETCPSVPWQSNALEVPIFLGNQFWLHYWLASINVGCKENCYWYVPVSIGDFIAQCLVYSRCSTWMSYSGSVGCGPKGHEVDCRPPSRILYVLSCVCPKQVCSGMSPPSMRHLFLFAGTFHSLCLLLLKGHLNCRAFISCSERMYFPPECSLPSSFPILLSEREWVIPSLNYLVPQISLSSSLSPSLPFFIPSSLPHSLPPSLSPSLLPSRSPSLPHHT